MHGGASQYWFAATVENAVYPTAKMEVSSDQGAAWKSTTRDVSNFFKLKGPKWPIRFKHSLWSLVTML
ncbi:hypothetical protein PG989_000698 [Apiospora arundinis]